MYCLVKKYLVSSDHTKFEDAHGRNGMWFKFYEACDDFLGYELMKGSDGKTYLILEKWISEEDYQGFIATNKTEFQNLEIQSRDFYDEEISLGSYDLLQ